MNATFTTTLWDRIRDPGGDGRAGIDYIARRYRAPVLGYIRARGYGEAEAEDLVQEVFVEVSRPGFSDRLKAVRARFRSYLLGLTLHVIQEHHRREGRQKRGGGRPAVSIDDSRLGLDPAEPGVSGPGGPDREFDSLWTLHLLHLAMERLKEEEGTAGSGPYHTLLRAYAIEGRPIRQLAEGIARSEQAVKNLLHRARRRLKAIFDELVFEYSGDEAAFKRERQALDPIARSTGPGAALLAI